LLTPSLTLKKLTGGFKMIFLLWLLLLSNEEFNAVVPIDEPWITPRFEVDHAAKTQFSNDPTFSTFVEGRFNGMTPNREYVGPYDEKTKTTIYKYARTTESRRIKWRYVPLYYYDYNTATKTRTLKLGGYSRRYPDTKTQIEVQQYWYNMPKAPVENK
jgi:hypothetical protein